MTTIEKFKIEVSEMRMQAQELLSERVKLYTDGLKSMSYASDTIDKIVICNKGMARLIKEAPNLLTRELAEKVRDAFSSYMDCNNTFKTFLEEQREKMVYDGISH